MVMYDPLYVRPDDLGTQRSRALALTDTDSLPAVVEVIPRQGDRESTTVPVPVITEERRGTRPQDRRRGERRKQALPCLIDTRSHRERRRRCRRRDDAEQFSRSERDASSAATRGIDIVV